MEDKIKYSIVIPTYNHCDDLLKPCIESIRRFTDMSNVEIIVVANGCTDNTLEYLRETALNFPSTKSSRFAWVWSNEPLGYTKATNLGIKEARGEYVILLNNDVEVLESPSNTWINQLESPFLEDPDVGITGPSVFKFILYRLEYRAVAFWCAMIKRKLFKELGMLDEIFTPGMGEDGDFSIRAVQAGYKLVQVPGGEEVTFGTRLQDERCMLWHKGSQTFGDEEKRDYYGRIVARNHELLLERYGRRPMRHSIVIPTYNHCDDLLKPCIESIIQYTDLSDTEVIVVANGCTDGTKEYMEGMVRQNPAFRMIWFDDAIGYTAATNAGIKTAQGEFVVLLNNDTLLLHQSTNMWLDILREPFADPIVGLTGPLQLHDDYANFDVLIFFCVMIRKELFDKIGILDEIFSPGGGEDIDFTVRAVQAGYKAVQITQTQYNGATNVGNFPIWHKNNQTFGEIPIYTKHIVKRNGLINCKRYNKNIKLNIGSGGVEFPGYLSVDLNDQRAHIIMDCTKLEFDDNTVTEILGSHVFEHLNPFHSSRILSDWLRVLKPGGKLILETPDIMGLCQEFLASNHRDRYGVLNAIYGAVNTTSIGGSDEITSPHLYGWWPESMHEHLAGVGYVDITFGPEQIPHPHTNFRTEARKPLYDANLLRKHDAYLYKEVFEDNPYKCQREDVAGRIVVDVGANIGYFTLLARSLGAMHVVAVEAQPTIFKIGLSEFLKHHDHVTLVNKAVTKNSGDIVLLENNHVGSKIGSTGEAVETITLHDVIKDIPSNDMVLKMDIEGAEVESITHSSIEDLRRFKVVFIEVHNDLNFDVSKKLQMAGFKLISSFQQKGGNVSAPETWVAMDIFCQKWIRE